jgi:putative endonuclease
MRRKRRFFVYIMTNFNNTVLYTGVTGNFVRRAHEHITGRNKSFTSRYNCNKLVYYEGYDDAGLAIAREKQIKAGSRKKKIDLINIINNEWKDLFHDLY